jgi:diaminopimelate decarboxylase
MQFFDHNIWPDTATQIDEQLALGGCTVETLVQQFGTPVYVLDELTLEQTALRFKNALQTHYPAPSTAHYASKALLNVPVAQLVNKWGLGLDCVSLGEVTVARHAGVALDHVHFHGNAKPRHELEQALAWGIGRIIVDSLDELQLLAELTQDWPQQSKAPQPILLRLNPGIDVHTHAHIQTGQLDSKFGLPIETGMAWQAAEIALQAPGLALVGVHAHLGSQITDYEPLAQGVERLLAFAAELQQQHEWKLQELSPGGGLAVPYQAGDVVTDIDVYVRTLAEAVITGCKQHGLALPRLVIEPGRSVIARSVVSLYRVVGVKHIPDVRTFVAVDGGMGDNIRPALYQSRYSAIRADRLADDAVAPVTVVGRYCESGDVLLRDVPLPTLESGAILAVPMVGAYTLSMASTYNLVPRPAFVGVRDGQARVLQRRETYDDLVRRDTMLTLND